MKKMIMLLSLIPLMALTQTQQIPTIRLMGIENPTVCPGDSIEILYKMELGDWQQVNLTGTNLSQIWQVAPALFALQPYTIINGIQVHRIKLRILPNMVLGQGLMYVPNFPEIFTIYFACTETGLKENELNAGEIKYYDLMGNKVEKSFGQLLIQQKGLRFNKVIISEQ